MREASAERGSQKTDRYAHARRQRWGRRNIGGHAGHWLLAGGATRSEGPKAHSGWVPRAGGTSLSRGPADHVGGGTFQMSIPFCSVLHMRQRAFPTCRWEFRPVTVTRITADYGTQYSKVAYGIVRQVNISSREVFIVTVSRCERAGSSMS